MKLKYFYVAGLLCAGMLSAKAAVLYVKADQTNNVPDGLSWSTAFPGVQQSVNAANDGDEVWVAAGTYFGNVTVKTNVALYGGFNGTESGIGDRNWLTNLSVLDGGGTNTVVRIGLGLTNRTRVDGFVIRNGNAGVGGGVYCSQNAAPLILNNSILWNKAAVDGAGIFCDGSSPVIASNLIQGNLCGEFVDGASAINCRFSIGARILNNRIIGNATVPGSGGGPGHGPIVCIGGQSVEIVNNFILANSNYGTAGGIYMIGGSSHRIINNTIGWFRAQAFAPAIFCSSSSSVIIANNIVAFCTAGVSVISSSVTFENNCVFGNTTNYIGFPNPTGINGNISVDPQLLTNVYIPNGHLLATSPCRDAGKTAYVAAGSLDVDGGLRVVGAAVDIGADEFAGAPPELVPAIVRVSPGGNDLNDGSSWPNAKRSVQSAIDTVTLTGGEAWVAGGTYFENLTLRHFVQLYGGFSGNETNREQRDWTLNPTVLDGRRLGSVVSLAGLDKWCAVDGFVIQNGGSAQGGGIFCASSSPLITHSVITKNAATNTGVMGLFTGGGIYCSYGVPVITANVISSNTALAGAGIYAYANAGRILNNRIERNVAGQSGGGVYRDVCINDLIANNFFLENICSSTSGSDGGGGIAATGTGARIIGNTLVGNQSAGRGGSIWAPSTPTLVNNLVAFGGSGVQSSFDPVNVRNNCIFGNGTNDLYPVGTNGNIGVDPLLLSLTDYHLSGNSPCINAGSNSDATNSPDLDGNPRISDGIVDIGAQELLPAADRFDAWLQQYGLPADGSADSADTDGDGLNNWQEWRAQTVPTNALSVLRMFSPANDQTDVTVSWTSTNGVAYFLQRTPALAPTAFLTLKSNISGLPGTTSYTDTNVIGSGPFFYRVGIQQ